MFVRLVYCDSLTRLQVFSFVYEPRYNPDARFPPAVLAATVRTFDALAPAEELSAQTLLRLHTSQESSLSEILAAVMLKVSSVYEDRDGLDAQLLFVFVLHCVLLPYQLSLTCH